MNKVNVSIEVMGTALDAYSEPMTIYAAWELYKELLSYAKIHMSYLSTKYPQDVLKLDITKQPLSISVNQHITITGKRDGHYWPYFHAELKVIMDEHND